MFRSFLFAILALSLVVIGVPGDAMSQGVTQAVVIDTNGQNDVLIAEAGQAAATFKRLEIDATRRYLVATLAGDQSGSLVITIDYPSLKAYADAQEKLAGDDSWQAYIQRINEQGFTIQSNSMWADRTP